MNSDRSEAYTYDNLHRLRGFARGTLDTSDPTVVDTPIADPGLSAAQSWSDMDRRGNWTAFDYAQGSSGSLAFAEQTRQHDGVNQTQRVDTQVNGMTLGRLLTYDPAGNLVAIDLVGDVNCDGLVNNFDTDAFVMLITGADENENSIPDYDECCSDCLPLIGDVNGDNAVDNFDIDAFVSLLLSGSASGQCARRFEYDEESRLTKVSAFTGGDSHALLEITYDALGRRVETRDYADYSGGPAAGCEPLETPAVTRHVYDGIQPVEEFVWAGGSETWLLAREFLWGERFPEPLERVTGPGLPGYGVVYGFVADSDLVGVIDYNTDASTTLLRTTRLIEDHRDLVDSVENKWVGGSGNTVVSKYDYTNDELGRRTGVTRTGVAFATTQPVAWAYNDRNELLDETRSDPGLTGEQLAKLHVAYSYDAIGNRTFEPAGEDRFVRVEGDLGEDEVPSGDDNPPHDEPAASTYYNVNALNQYERVERPYVPSEYDAVFPAFSQRLTYDFDGNLVASRSSGDANCDGIVNNFDIDDFVLALLNPDATDDVGESPLQSAPPTGYTGDDTCWNQRRVWGDITGDGSLDNFDIDPFADVLQRRRSLLESAAGVGRRHRR